MPDQVGLHFCKIDLHTHTPASRCYQASHTPEEIVQTALDKGLAAIAVTDHNTAAWIDKMKAAAQTVALDGKKLIIFPGVEISTHEEFHVVALFSPQVGQSEVENFLGAIGLTPQEYGRAEAVCEKSVYDILDLIHDRKGLGILAHIDTVKGAFREMREFDQDTGRVRVPASCSKLFNDERYDAVEVTERRLPDGFDAAHNIKRSPAYYQASDNPDPANPIKHSKDGLAARFSWFHLDEMSLEGLRQCFADPEVRIRQMDAWSEHAWPHVRRLKIGNAGFLAYQQLTFHPGLNSIIGGKGVGKSLAIEFLRFALGQPSQHDDIQRDHVGKLDKRLEPLNTVEVEFQLDNGVTYVLQRTYDGNGSSSFVCANQQTGERYTGDVPQLFPVLAYSQTEVIKIAEDASAQLRLVDSLIDPRSFQKALEEIQEQLSQNDRLVTDALGARIKAEDAKQEIATLGEQIANIDRMLTSPLMAQMRSVDVKKEAFTGLRNYVTDLLTMQGRYLKEVTDRTPPSLPDDVAADPVLQDHYAQLAAVHADMVVVLEKTGAQITEAQTSLEAAYQAWLPEFDDVRRRYEDELRGTSSARLETDRRQLTVQKTLAENNYARYRRQAEEELPALLQQRQTLLNQLEEQHQAYYQARKEKFDHLTHASDGKLQLSLTHATNRETYAEALNRAWRGSSATTISTAYRQRVAENVTPRQLGDMIIARDVEQLAQTARLAADVAERAMNKLWSVDDLTETLALQHAYYPDDTPSIKFNKGRNQFAELNELSIGQKCTALLIIALCDGTMPVVIDQPEDALDIASVWEDIAKKLRRGKYSRQFILTTHNSSLAVGSDSDSFTVLVPQSGDRAKVSQRGAIDRGEVRQAVIEHLEGGDEPYKLRQRKYNIR